MLLCGIIEELTRLYGETSKISFFFCQATDMRINSATSVIRGLIYLLIDRNPSLLSYVRARYDQAGKALFEDRNAWNALSVILMDILEDPSLKGAYLMVDALDECTDGLRSILDFIVQESSARPQIKWIVTSRNWPEIEERLSIATQIAPISLELNENSVSEAVNNFIQHKVEYLAKEKKYKEEVRERIYQHLVLNSQGTFLWVALVCQNLERTPPRHAVKKLESFPPRLDALYSRIMDQVRKSEDAEVCKQILAAVSTVYRPITLSELTSLIEMPNNENDDHDTLSEIVKDCGSFLILRTGTIAFVHQSAKDFIFQEVHHEILPRGIESEHRKIFSQSLEALLKTLRRDILDVKLPGVSAKDIAIPSPNPLATVEYACIYWVDHLYASKCNATARLNQNDKNYITTFLQGIFLYWIEALGILESLSDGIRAMKKLESLVRVGSIIGQRWIWLLTMNPL